MIDGEGRKVRYRISWEASGIHTEEFDRFIIDPTGVKAMNDRDDGSGVSEERVIMMGDLIQIVKVIAIKETILIGTNVHAQHLEDPFGTGED